MNEALLDQLKREIRYEFAREGPPEGFPKFPDIPGGRYTDPAFFDRRSPDALPMDSFLNDWGDDEDPAIVEMRANRLHQRTIVMEEDTRNMTPIQKSLDSPGLIGIPTSSQERRIWNCAEQIDRTIGPERIPEHLRVPQLLAPYIEH